MFFIVEQKKKINVCVSFSILGTYLNFGELLCKLIVLIISLEEGIIIILDQIILCHLVTGVSCAPVGCCNAISLASYLKNVTPPPAMTIQYVSSKHLLGRKPTLVDSS